MSKTIPKIVTVECPNTNTEKGQHSFDFNYAMLEGSDEGGKQTKASTFCPYCGVDVTFPIDGEIPLKDSINRGG